MITKSRVWRKTLGALALLVGVAATSAAMAGGAGGGSLKDEPLPPAFSWTGVYLGGHVGYTWAEQDWAWEIPGIVPSTFGLTSSAGGAIGGLQAGFRQQFGVAVPGVEVSFSGMDLRDEQVALGFGLDRTWTWRMDDLVTVTGQLGFAIDRALIYFKGGYANADLKLDTFRTSDGLHQTTSLRREHGWTVGGGFEYASPTC